MASNSSAVTYSSGMVFIEDKGSLFDASIDMLWKYLLNGEEHDKAHKSTRNSSFKLLSDTSFIYSSERNMNGRWVKESLRITIFPPLGVATEMIKGPFAGSKMFYVYSSKGSKTQIDVFGEFTSKEIPHEHLEQTVRESLERDFTEDAPAIRAFAKKNKQPKKSNMVFVKDVASKFEAPIDVVWNYFLHGGEVHSQAHKYTRNYEVESASETSSVISSEHKRHGRWTSETVRMTNLVPLGYVFEMLKGRHAGSKMFYVYTPKGNNTQIDVYGYFKSRYVPRNQLKREVLDDLENDFDEDAHVLKSFAQKK
jgi:hypothetical protein